MTPWHSKVATRSPTASIRLHSSSNRVGVKVSRVVSLAEEGAEVVGSNSTMDDRWTVGQDRWTVGQLYCMKYFASWIFFPREGPY
jgi:hypothetical protein